jgi:aminoglycoside N3'-acetyltransferase
VSGSRPSIGDLADDLRSLGVGAGSRILIHSSLRSVRSPPPRADDVLDALLDAVGASGLVVAPTFTYVSDSFDPGSTPGRTGALGEALRRRPNAVRSLHPFYSLAAVGDGAEALLAGHETMPGTAVDSPLGRLARQDGHVLMLGVGHVANTTVHVGEFQAQVPYLDIPFDPDWPSSARIALGDGSAREVAYDAFPGCSRAFGTVEHRLRERSAVRDGRIGRAAVQLIPGSEVIDVTAELLHAAPSALLCTDSRCYRCTRARQRLRQVGRDRGGEADRAR